MIIRGLLTIWGVINDELPKRNTAIEANLCNFKKRRHAPDYYEPVVINYLRADRAIL